MSTHQISVGIPTFNNQRTIWDTLSGFADQTRPPDRVHIVDASTDWTPEIVRLFEDTVHPPYELVVERQSNSSGVGAARSKIYDQFDGDILACFDTNATPDQNWIKRHLRTHEKRSSVDIVSGVGRNRTDEIVRSPHDRGYFVQKNCSVKRRALEAVSGWDELFDRGEDWDIAIRLWQNGSTAFVRDDLNRKRIRDDGTVDRLQTRLDRPSSVRFLRKYGIWYAKFHPMHVAGDALSLFAVGSLLCSLPFVGGFGLSALLLMLAVPILGAVGYTVVKARAETDGQIGSVFVAQHVAEFFILSYTTGREILYGPTDGWNYGGIN